jgi:hypothetical protein
MAEEREIWRASEGRVREVLRRRRLRLTGDEYASVLNDLPLYLEIALEECVVALARQHMRRRRGDGERPPASSGQ